jgi:hypothetical protein
MRNNWGHSMPIKRTAASILDLVSGEIIGYQEQRGDKVVPVLNTDNGEREKLGCAETVLVESARNELRGAGFPTDDDIIAANQAPGAEAGESMGAQVCTRSLSSSASARARCSG